MSFIKDFKAFAMKGYVMDLAVTYPLKTENDSDNRVNFLCNGCKTGTDFCTNVFLQ